MLGNSARRDVGLNKVLYVGISTLYINVAPWCLGVRGVSKHHMGIMASGPMALNHNGEWVRLMSQQAQDMVLVIARCNNC